MDTNKIEDTRTIITIDSKKMKTTPILEITMRMKNMNREDIIIIEECIEVGEGMDEMTIIIMRIDMRIEMKEEEEIEDEEVEDMKEEEDMIEVIEDKL